MEQDGLRLTDLPTDVLRRIITYLATSDEGATDFAKALSVCKAFNRFSNDREILKVANFDNMDQHYLNDALWDDNGLLTRCATVGNEGARLIIQQIPFLLLGMGQN
ncbi:putative F-box domain-containing protein [Helianthus anomalus]